MPPDVRRPNRFCVHVNGITRGTTTAILAAKCGPVNLWENDQQRFVSCGDRTARLWPRQSPCDPSSPICPDRVGRSIRESVICWDALHSVPAQRLPAAWSPSDLRDDTSSMGTTIRPGTARPRDESPLRQTVRGWNVIFAMQA